MKHWAIYKKMWKSPMFRQDLLMVKVRGVFGRLCHRFNFSDLRCDTFFDYHPIMYKKIESSLCLMSL